MEEQYLTRLEVQAHVNEAKYITNIWKWIIKYWNKIGSGMDDVRLYSISAKICI